jgi:hypothetical protein
MRRWFSASVSPKLAQAGINGDISPFMIYLEEAFPFM